MPLPEVIVVTLSFFEGCDVSLPHGVDEVDLAGVQRCQAHGVLLFGFADDFVQIGQVIALGISLPGVFKAHHAGLAIARSGDKLERTRADGMLGRRVKGVERHHTGRVVSGTPEMAWMASARWCSDGWMNTGCRSMIGRESASTKPPRCRRSFLCAACQLKHATLTTPTCVD
jgi:hypothetical protein